MLAGRFGRVDRHLIVGLVAILDAEVVIVKVNIEIGVDQLVLDGLPDDPGHLVPVHLHNRILDLDLAHLVPAIQRLKLVSPASALHARTDRRGL